MARDREKQRVAQARYNLKDQAGRRRQYRNASRAYRLRNGHEIKLCEALGITMREARKIIKDQGC